MTKEDGNVTYLHGESGADNNGMRTGPILNGVCYAQAIWGGHEMLLRKLVRGFISWVIAMERESVTDRGILTLDLRERAPVDTYYRFFRNDKLWEFTEKTLFPWLRDNARQLSFRRRIRFWSAASSPRASRSTRHCWARILPFSCSMRTGIISSR